MSPGVGCFVKVKMKVKVKVTVKMKVKVKVKVKEKESRRPQSGACLKSSMTRRAITVKALLTPVSLISPALWVMRFLKRLKCSIVVTRCRPPSQPGS